MAEVLCGGCNKRFFVSAAHAEEAQEAFAALPGELEHAARIRQRTAQFSPARWRIAARAVLALGLPLALALFALWDLGRLGPLQPALSAQLQVVGSADNGLTLQDVTVAPYAPTGGREGLLVRGKVALHDDVQPVELAAHGSVPFIGLLSLPEDAGAEPWQVAVKWLGAEQSAAQIP